MDNKTKKSTTSNNGSVSLTTRGLKRNLTSKKWDKIILPLVIIGLIGLAYFGYAKIVSYHQFRKIHETVLGEEIKEMEKVKECKQAFDASKDALVGVDGASKDALMGADMLSLIFTEEEKENEGEGLEEYFKNKCPDWTTCSIETILRYMRLERWLYPDTKLLEDKDLWRAVRGKYSDWAGEKYNLAQKKLFLDDLLWLFTSSYMDDIFIEGEKDGWVANVTDYISYLLYIYSDSPASEKVRLIGPPVIALRFAFEVKNIDDLKDRPQVNFERVKKVLCDEFAGSTDFDFKNVDISDLWFYISTKDFCQIPLAVEEEEQVMKKIDPPSSETFSVSRFKEAYFFFSHEYFSYLLINRHKIFYK